MNSEPKTEKLDECITCCEEFVYDDNAGERRCPKCGSYDYAIIVG